MKAIFIIGIILLVGGISLGYAASKPLTSLSDKGEKIYSTSIVLGFLAIGIASILYIKKNA